MDYYDHDEGERKQMHHSGGAARVYRSGQDESGGGKSSCRGRDGSSVDSDGGSGIVDKGDYEDYDEDEAADSVNF